METKVKNFYADQINQNIIVPEELTAADKQQLANLYKIKEILEKDGHRNLRPSFDDTIEDMSDRIQAGRISVLQNSTLVSVGETELTLNNENKTPYHIATYVAKVKGEDVQATAMLFKTNMDQTEFKVGEDYLVNHRFRIENGGVVMNSTYTSLQGGAILSADEVSPSLAGISFDAVPAKEAREAAEVGA